MRPQLHLRLLLTVVLLLVSGLSCGEVDVTAVDPATVDLDPDQETFRVGELRQFAVHVADAAGNELRGRTVEWSVSDPAVASVDEQGRVTGLTPGQARVIARVEGVSGEAGIIIMAMPVETVDVQPATTSIAHDGSVQLQVTLRAADGTTITGPPISFASENAAIATVDAAGLVRAAGEGTTRITATAEGKAGGATITVSPKPVARVVLAPASQSLFVGEVVGITATLTAADGSVLTGRALAWRTSDAAVATVDGAGSVTGAGAGSATITATAEGIDGTATVTVSPQPVAKATVSPASATLLTGQTATLTVVLEAADGTPLTGRTVAWSSETPGVAFVSPATGSTTTVTAIAAGTTTITAIAEDVSGTATIAVAEPVAAVTITPPAVRLAPGGTQTFQAELRSASGALLTGRAIAWTTSDPGVFALAVTSGESVNGSAAAAGTAIITATAEGVSGTAGVTVALNVGSIAIAPNPPPDLFPGQALDLTATVRASDGTVLTDRPVTWTADPAQLAISTSGSVNERARITALAAQCNGESCSAAVSASADAMTTQMSVRVLKPVASIAISPPSATVNAGGTVTLSATLRAADATVLTGRALTWSSLTPALATVDPATGVVTGSAAPSCAAGSETCAATIRATAMNDPATASDDVVQDVTISVRKPVAAVTVTPATATVDAGGTQQYTATPSAADGTALTQRTIAWSATAGVATVNPAAGATTTATGVAPGTATVTATAEGVSGSAQLIVLPRVASVTVVPNAATLVPGAAHSFTAELRDASGGLLTGRPVAWTSSDPAVFPLDANAGASVSGTAGTDGTAIITASSGGVNGTATVTVLTPVASVTVLPPTADLVPGDVQTFTAELRDANGAVLTGRTVTWMSTVTNVLALSTTVGESVSGTAGADGSSTIVATAEGKVGTATVSVTTPVHSVTIVPGSVTLSVLGTQSFTAELRDANGNLLTGHAIDWDSNNPVVFLLTTTPSGPTVSGRALLFGTATVTATAGGISGTATVTVTLVPEPAYSFALPGETGAGRLARPGSADPVRVWRRGSMEVLAYTIWRRRNRVVKFHQDVPTNSARTAG